MAFMQLFKTSQNAGGEDHYDFAPGLLGIQDHPPSPLPSMVLRGVLILFLLMLLWSIFGRLDIVAVAEGKLVPVTYLKIVQPADAGIVQEILIQEGQHVMAGQVLVRMDQQLSNADSTSIQQQMQGKALELRRIQAELANLPFTQKTGDAPELFHHVAAEYTANRNALNDAMAEARFTLEKARQDLAATEAVKHKLEQTLPAYQASEQAYAKLGKDGFAGNLMVLDKQRERIEKEQDLKASHYNAQSLRATIAQADKHMAQIQSSYRQKLQAEKAATYADYQKLQQEWAKQAHRNSLLELKAPQAGIVKDLATHTPGTVVSPGTVLMTLVPNNEALQAEVSVKNEDAGFVHAGQEVKLKLSAYPFQKYGMITGAVTQVSADASDSPNANNGNNNNPNNANRNNDNQSTSGGQLAYRSLVSLKQQTLDTDGKKLSLTPGMQVAAEIKLGDQTVMEYLLSPVRKAFQEAGRER
jgi:hemolysin D